MEGSQESHKGGLSKQKFHASKECSPSQGFTQGARPMTTAANPRPTSKATSRARRDQANLAVRPATVRVRQYRRPLRFEPREALQLAVCHWKSRRERSPLDRRPVRRLPAEALGQAPRRGGSIMSVTSDPPPSQALNQASAASTSGCTWSGMVSKSLVKMCD